ncbi:MAG: acetolactate synthase large subunit [Ktedonobacteraceae bacterium]|nr:acetolactate synthase large subunit [Ktedonobacteraceae bacterium]
MTAHSSQTVAQFIVQCLENEGVQYVFGIPGEENIHLVDAFRDSSIRFILVRHEQGASFMADIYGRLTMRAGVCLATLGPGAINLLLGTADANSDSVPLVAISAQVGINRGYKESHQRIDLVNMFRPVTKWAELVQSAEAIPEMVRSAFKQAQTERQGATYLGIPEDIESQAMPKGFAPLLPNTVYDSYPSSSQIQRAVAVLRNSKRPIILAGHGATRNQAQAALIQFSEQLDIPVATTFMGKGVFPDNHPNSLGTMGFMRHDYANFGFDHADTVICVGYDLQEFSPAQINPKKDKNILHIHRYPASVDAHYAVTVGIEGNIAETLAELAREANATYEHHATSMKIRQLLHEEREKGKNDSSYPVKPQRLVADTRAALGDGDIVLADTGAIKMWMARLYPTYQPNTCLISNGLATMAFSLPGAIAAKLAYPEKKILAVMGDGGFLMNSQEIETAIREKAHFVVLVWVDNAYGLIKWKMDLGLGRDSYIAFNNPDFVKYAESFGAKGYFIERTEDLLPTLQKALADETVSIIACPVDASENDALTDKLGKLTLSL